ncbi:DUF1566 domain-containing protein [Polaribacter sp. Z014]|uniref:Lcl C-terminal domain-containing protein n=1 Tax=Polaribacter sp. Z014 TaxID=2927126 RepID=UPI0020223EC4|nr:DUF1566 domain-containing protein [Polaribacter sp. Z014]MCL7762696.1 DUF1566 domain-containing protein [Polaribacter sp. Z014]
MKQIVKLKKETSFIVIMIIALFAFNACSSDDDNVATDEGSSELTINDYVQIATGQVTLYDKDGAVINSLSSGDTFYGQDANYLKGVTMSFNEDDEGITTDNNTGLMWEQIPTTDEFTWEEAKEYCENLELGGYDDWRMPNLKELYSVADFGKGWPYIDTNYFALASGEVSKDEQFWSSNLYVGVTVEGGANAAFGVNIVTGHIKAYAASMPEDGGTDGGTPPDGNTPPPGDGNGAPTGNPLAKYVRAVRGDVYGTNSFTANGDDTVSDSNTGLMWAQGDDGVTLDWADALAYAENSELAGYTDWRLPNVKELQGIVDYSHSPTATDAANVGPAIDPIFDCTEMISEAGYDDYGYYWTGTSANFTSGQPYYYAWYVAFGRAVNDEGEDFHGAGGVRFDTKDVDGPAGEDAERYYNYVRLVRDIN